MWRIEQATRAGHRKKRQKKPLPSRYDSSISSIARSVCPTILSWQKKNGLQELACRSEHVSCVLLFFFLCLLVLLLCACYFVRPSNHTHRERRLIIIGYTYHIQEVYFQAFYLNSIPEISFVMEFHSRRIYIHWKWDIDTSNPHRHQQNFFVITIKAIIQTKNCFQDHT